MPSSLSTVKGWIDKKISNKENRRLAYKFANFMDSTDTSEHYRRGNLIVVISFAKYIGSKNISKVNSKSEITEFLDSKRTSDPDKKWIRTWNDYYQRIKYFMRWLHNGAPNSISNSFTPQTEWKSPEFVRIKPKKTNRLSPYSESEIWERDDLLTIIKYEPHKRNKAALALCWDLDARPHEVTLLKIKNLRLGPKYAEGEIPHESKTGTGPLLLACSFPYVRDWLNEHPFRNEPNARVICNQVTGRAVKADTLAFIMKQLQKRIIRHIESGEITDLKEREKLEFLLKTKRWIPYCIRHSAITADSDYLPEYALKKKARWSMNSRQPSRYIKTRMGNDLKQKILSQNGIITEDEARPTPTVADCARCHFINPLENKYCSSCGYPLSVAAYEELKAAENAQFQQMADRMLQTEQFLRQHGTRLQKMGELMDTVIQKMNNSRQRKYRFTEEELAFYLKNYDEIRLVTNDGNDKSEE